MRLWTSSAVKPSMPRVSEFILIAFRGKDCQNMAKPSHYGDSMTLRPYQQQISDKIDVELQMGRRSILTTCPTGGGKTHLISHRAMIAAAFTLEQAHRQELVFQIAMALARDGLEHRIYAPNTVIDFIIEKQIEQLGKHYVYGGAQHAVASVDTLLARADELGNWVHQVGLVQTDEGHHVLETNKWGRALKLFPNAIRLAWTGTAMRPDRKSLRLTHGGLYDGLVIGPSTRDLLEWGFLCPFKIFGPPPSIDTSDVNVGASGDYCPDALGKAAH